MTTILDYEEIQEVKNLANSAVLRKVLTMIEDQAVGDWKNALDAEERERCWYTTEAIQKLAIKITSLATDEKVRDFNNRIRRTS
jgi:hypothetical protein